EKIEDGYLYVRDEGPRIVLEATGVNFELKSDVERAGLLEVMAELLSYLQDPIQILVRSRVYEPDEYFESLEAWRQAWPQAKRELREQRLSEYKEKLRTLAEGNEIKDRRFYIVVPYSQHGLTALVARARRRPAVPGEAAATQLAQKERQIQSVLWRAGIKTRRLSSAEIEELFYYAYDPAMARIQKLRSSAAGVRQISVRPLDQEQTASIERRLDDIRQMIVPAALEIGSDHVVSRNRENTYLRTLYVHDYPRDVEANWLKEVLSLDFNLDVSLHIRPLDPQHARRRLDANERELAGTLGAVADDAPTARDLEERLEDIAYAKEEFRQKSKWFQLSLYFMPHANSREGLDQATRAIEDRIAGLQFRTQRALYRQEQGLNSVLPQATDRLRHTRGISTRPLAAAFPFNAADQIEAAGYLFGVVGRDDTAKSLLVLNPRTWDNPHLLVLGWSGNGKSHNAKEKCLTEWIAGSHVAVIDPRSEWTQLAEHCAGEVVPIHLGSPKTMNLWDLPQEGERNPFTSKVPQLINFWRLALGYLPEEEVQLLDGAITSAYSRVGIDPGDPTSWTQPPPITGDFQAAILERYGEDERARLAARSLAGRLDKFTNGYLGPLFNRRSNVNLANDFVVFDVRTVRTEQSDLLPLVYWLILNHLRTWMTTHVRRRTICIDEFWSLARHPEGMAFVDEMSRTARHAYTQLVLISQSVSDMLSSQQAIASLSSMATTILHKQHPDHVARVMETFHLSDEEARRLQNARRGQCLVITGNGEHVTMQTVEYEPEHELYCTEPFK
ncbi:MAG: ATP-binding protein, partial [Candidatus Dormibacteraeota bacterium]|nr:ATP-binding protein [Candidatus Dormibacteraeota bacterium]